MARKTNVSLKIIQRSMVVLLIGIVIITTALASYVQQRLVNKVDENFTKDTKATTRRIVDNIRSYDEILYNARAFITSTPSVSQDSWNAYFTSQGTLDRYDSISSIVYAEVVPHAEKDAFIQRIKSGGYLGKDFDIRPSGDRPSYLVGTLAVSKNDLSSAYGFDSYSTASRRVTYQSAEKINGPRASGPITLATGYPGFFVTIPVMNDANTAAKGFILVTFRTADFTSSLVESTPESLAVKITDISGKETTGIFETKNWQSAPHELTRQDNLSFAGRIWHVEFASKRTYDFDNRFITMIPNLILITATALSVSICLGYIIYARQYESKR